LKGSDDFDVARLHQNIGVVLRKDKEYKEANESFMATDKIISRLQEVSPNDPKIANLYNDFGLLHLNEKNFNEAYKYYNSAYEIREKNYNVFGKSDDNFYLLEFAFSVHNMGTYYNKCATESLEETSDAEKREFLLKAAELHERAYDLRIGLLGKQDVLTVAMPNNSMSDICLDVAQSLTLLASDLAELGETELALEKCKLGLAIREVKYGNGAEPHQVIAWSFYTLGTINEKMDNNYEALKCFTESYRIRRYVRNGDHPYAARALFQMGRLKSTMAHPDAMMDLKKAREIQQRTLSSDNPELVETLELIKKLEG